MRVESAESMPDEPFADVLALSLTELRTTRHPVLSEVLDDLRERAAQPGEMLWGYGSAF
ncbi:FxSxx-COOH cyclophane-containing RiPP peptide [Streptomyces longwoodensis]|uniref:FxSxx-COOH cyclophane-containing RiPP peptide n=1 Tax=Streptomyces longwoodensis TaxID=68231 RepID=UPI0036FC471F